MDPLFPSTVELMILLLIFCCSKKLVLLGLNSEFVTVNPKSSRPEQNRSMTAHCFCTLTVLLKGLNQFDFLD